MLLAGEVDAMIAPNVTRTIGEGDPRVARLFRTTGRSRPLTTAHGIFPIMHVTTIRRKSSRGIPGCGEPRAAFEEAKQLAYRRLANPRNVPLAWFRTWWEEERALLGPDPWNTALRAEQEKLRHADRMGARAVLTGARPKLADLFPREAFELELPCRACTKSTTSSEDDGNPAIARENAAPRRRSAALLPGCSFLPYYLVGTHHLVFLVLKDMAVEHVQKFLAGRAFAPAADRTSR